MSRRTVEELEAEYRELCMVCGRPSRSGDPGLRVHPLCSVLPEAWDALAPEITKSLGRRFTEKNIRPFVRETSISTPHIAA